jgi:hypothetical protein
VKDRQTRTCLISLKEEAAACQRISGEIAAGVPQSMVAIFLMKMDIPMKMQPATNMLTIS